MANLSRVSSFILLLSFQLQFGFAQTDKIRIKETYDIIGNDLIINLLNNGNQNFNSFTDDYINSWWSLLDMYRTTKDKSYLIRFAKISIWVEQNRKDQITAQQDPDDWPFFLNKNLTFSTARPLWFYYKQNQDATFDEIFYQNGMNLGALTEFVYLVKNEEPGLMTQSIINKETSISILSEFDENRTETTLGAFANWLLLRIDESMPFLIDLRWEGQSFAYPKDNFEKADGLNYQSLLSVPLHYYGKLRPNQQISISPSQTNKTYSQLSAMIKDRYLGNKIFFLGDCITPSLVLPVFETMNGTSFKWFYEGWRTSCGFDPLLDDYEDVSHAVNSLQFIFATHNEIDPSNTQPFFDESFMTKLHNTLTENIFYSYDPLDCANTKIAPAVDGDLYVTYRYSVDLWPSFYFNFEYNGLDNPQATSTFWNLMPLAAYDGESGANGSVYEMIMNQFNNKCYPFPSANGMFHQGIARCAKAQWERECVSLTLYNRKLIYDQDFVVKNKLTIDPTYSTHNPSEYPFFNGDPIGYTKPDKPYADPVIEPVSNVPYSFFSIINGVECNMTAGDEITFLPGFEALAGCNFSASILPSSCTYDGKMMQTNNNPIPNANIEKSKGRITNTISNNNSYESNQSLQTKETSSIPSEIVIAPNPFRDMLKLSCQFGNKTKLNIVLFSLQGEKIKTLENNSNQQEGNYQKQFDLSDLPNGTYLLETIFNDQKIVKKVVKMGS